MKIYDLIQETCSALLRNKARSGLTILGIVIGIGSVIAMISIGQGAQSSIQSNIESMGSNLLLVYPGTQRSLGTQVRSSFGSAKSLTMEDVEAIAQQTNYISYVAPDQSGRYQVTAKGTNTNTQVMGVTFAYSTVRNVEVAEGDFISDQNVNNISKVAVLGPSVVEDLFGEDANAVGQTIRINKITFKVIGVTEEKGSSGMSNQDDMIYIPLTTNQKFLSGNEYLSTISIQVSDQNLMTMAQEEVTSLLLDQHNISDSTLADFRIMNQSDLVESASSIADTLTILLGSIAGISLIVGGIGIMNMMLTTVTERTREIGLRKAVGAKRKDINLQFLAEATMLTLIGGICGIILGWGIAAILTKLDVTTTKVSMGSVFLSFGVSAAIGIIFGYYPARRASRLNPIEALRYE